MIKYSPLKEFKLIAEKYLSLIEPLINAEKINNWCKNKTHGKIDKIIDKIEENTLMILLNAVYFRGVWLHKFNKLYTEKLQFYNLGNQEIKVDTIIMKIKIVRSLNYILEMMACLLLLYYHQKGLILINL